MEPNDILIRFETVKISAKNISPTQGINNVVFDAQCLYQFIKEGITPELDKKKED